MNVDNAPEESLMSHLIELRTRLIKAGGAVLLVFIILMIYPGQQIIYTALFSPMIKALATGTNTTAMIVVDPIDSFLIPVKLVGLVSLLLALPVVLYQAYAFIAPGLYRKEQRLILPVIVSSTLLFFTGIAFCHYFVFGTLFEFFKRIAPSSVSYTPDIAKVFGFVINLFLAFGLTFEIPIIVLLLVRLKMVSLHQLREIRGYVMVGAFIIAAIVTPPDVLSQCLLAIPMIGLYELGLFAARWVQLKGK